MAHKHRVFVYGTLRPGLNRELFRIPGVMYDLGAYPGVKLGDPNNLDEPMFFAEVVEVDDRGLERLDGYEGYNEQNPENSLYIRRPYLDGWIYEYNGYPHNYQRVETGDWLEHTERPRGTAAGLAQER